MPKPLPAVITTRRLNRAGLLRSTALQAVVGLVVATPALAQPAPNARPQGGQVVAGTASIANTANATNITQSTNRAAIDWRSFNVGSNQSVTFQQPSSAAITLNRVTGPDPSAIAGKISANGQIVLTNQSGVTFYQGAQVNAQSVIVSAAGITNQNFMAGKMVFDQAANPNARIENRGTITVKQAGLAALVAPSVANSGVINAKLGQVVLAGAAAHTLDMYGDGLVTIDVTKQVTRAPVGPDGKAVTALVTNSGTIRADGGVVQLTASAADGVVQTLVQAGGTIRANSVGDRTGRIEIAGTGGSVVLEGRLAADGRASGTTGGQIMIAGSDATTLAPTAHVTARGKAGGGTIALGTTLARARTTGAAPAGTSARTVIASGARVSADATDRGAGGRITVLSTQQTSVGGTLTARGGKSRGDGGKIEMSGEQGFRLTGSADTSAPHGALGSIVIDPRDLTISASDPAGGGTYNPTLASGVDPTLGYSTPNTATDAYVTPTQLTALTGDLHLQASRDLTVASTVNYTNGNVTLDAGRNLTINAGVTLSSNLSVTLNAASSGSPLYDPAGALTINGAVTAGGNIALTAGTGGIAIANNVNSNGSLLLSTTGPVTQSGGTVQTSDLYGQAASVALMGVNDISGITVYGGSFATTSGGFSLATELALTVGPTAGALGTVSVPTGQTILLQAPSLTLQSGANPAGTATLSAPGGVVAIQPNSENPILLTTAATKPAGLVLSTADLALITAGTLKLGSASPITDTITIGQSTDTGTLDLTSGSIGALQVQVAGSLLQNIPLKVSKLSGNAGTVALTNTANVIPSLAGLTSTGNVAVTTAGDLAVSGANSGAGFTAVSGGNLTLSGTLNASTPSLQATGALSIPGTVTTGGDLTLAAGSSGIGLSGTVTANGHLVLNTTGAVTQSAGTITATHVEGTAGSISLTSRSNSIFGLASDTNTLAASAGDVTVVDSHSLTVGSPSVNGGLSVPTGHTITLAADAVSIVTGQSGKPISAPSGTIAFTPFTTTNGILITGGSSMPANTLTITSGQLGQTTASTLQLGATIGATAMPTGATTLGVGAETLDFGSLGFTSLVTRTGGLVTQGAGGQVAVTSFSGQAGTLSLTQTSNYILNLAGFSTTAGDLAFHTGSGLVIPTGTTVIANGGLGNVTLSSAAQVTGLTSSGGRLVGMQILGTVTGNTVSLNSLPASGAPTSLNYGITEIDTTTNANVGVINATTLTGAGGFVQLYGNNALTNLGNFAAYEELSITNVNASSIVGALSSSTYAVALGAAGITQSATSSITAPQLDVTSSANTVLTSTLNVIDGIGAVTQSAGNFTLIDSNAGGLTFGGNYGVVQATSGSFTFVTNGVGIVASPNANTTIKAQNGSVTFTPYTDGRRIELIGASAADASSLSLSQTFLNLLNTPTLQLGVAAGTLPAAGTGIAGSGKATSAINIGNAGETITLTGHASTLNLVTTGAVTEGNGGAGALVVGNLTGNTGAVTLLGANQVGVLGSYVTSGAFQLSNTVALSLTGPLTSSSSIAASTSSTMSVSGTVTAPTVSLSANGGTLTQTAGTISASSTLTLNSSGLTSQTGGTISTAALTGTTGSLTLTQPGNAIGSVTGASSGAVSLTNATGFSIGQGTVFGDTTLTTVAGDIQISGAATFGNLTIAAAGRFFTGESGVLTATSLAGSAASLSISAGDVATLGNIQATDDFNYNSAQSVALAGTIKAATIEVSSTDGSATVSPISQTGGSLTAGTIDIQSSDAFTQSGGTISSTGTLGISSNGALNLGGTASGTTVTLTAADKGGNAGAITQPGGSLTATTLTGSASSVALTQTGNAIAQLGNVTVAGAGALQVTDGQALTVSGAVSAGNTTLAVRSGALTVSGSLSVANLALTVAGNAIGSAGATISVPGTLSGSAASLQFGNPVDVATLGNFATTNGLTLAASGNLAVTGTVTDGTSITLTSAGSTALSGSLTAPTIQVTASTVATGGGAAPVVYRPGTISQTAGSVNATTSLTLTAGDTLTQSAGTIAAGSGAVALSSVGTLSLGGTVSGGPVSLTAVDRTANPTFGQTALAGAVSQPGGTLTAATLTGNSSSTTALTRAGNAVATLASYTSVGGFSLHDGQALSVTGKVQDTVGITVSVTGGLALGNSLIAPALNISATGAITQSAGGIQSTTLTGSGATVALGSTSNQVATLNAFSATAGSFSLADAVALSINGAVSTAGTTPTLTILDNAPSLTTSGRLSAAGGMVVLKEAVVGNGITFTGPGFGASPITAQTLTIGSATGGPVVFAGGLNAGNVPTLDLESAGAITQTAPFDAATLTGTGASVTLTRANQVATLGAFTSSGAFALTNAVPLTVSGPVTSGGSTSVSTTGVLTVSGTMTAPAISLVSANGPSVTGGISQTSGSISGSTSVSLTSSGTINQSGGTITAGTLTGSSAGTTSLGSAGNAVATLGSFSSAGGFTLADGQALAVSGPVSDNTSVTLSTTGALLLSGTVTTGALSLTASGAITQPGGGLVATSLTGSGAGVSLTQRANQIGTLGGFSSTADFALTDSVALTVSGAVSAGSGRTLTLVDDSPTFGSGGSLSAPSGTVVLSEYTAGRGLTIAGGGSLTGTPPVTATTLVVGTSTGGPITVAGAFNLSTVSVLDLESGGAISETGAGAIRVATLTGNGASATLGGANQIGTLGRFTTAGAFNLTDAQSLAVSGPLSATTVGLSVTGNLALSGTITAPTSVSLAASGAITQPSGGIVTASLTGSATSASLAASGNLVTTLAGFATTGDFTLVDGRSLTVSAPVDPNTVTLSVTGDLALNSSVTAGTVVLSATGAITEGAGGRVIATTLTGSANAASLGQTNFVGTLGSFATTAGLSLVNGQTLTVSGPVVDGQSISVSTTGVLTVSGTMTAPAITLVSASGPSVTGGISQNSGSIGGSTSVSLTSSGTINQSGGTITAGTLTGSSAGTTNLGSAGNAVATLGSFSSAGGFTLADGQALAVSGPVSDSTAVTLSTTGALSLSGTVTTGALSLTASGAITQPGGGLVATSLTGSGAGVSLTQRANQIGTLGGFSSTADFALTDSVALTVSGAVSAGSGRTLTLVDDSPTFGSGGSLSAPSGTVVLSEYTAGRGLTIAGGGSLTGTPPVTATTLVVGTSTGGSITIAGAFNLSSVSVLDLESGGAISETGAGAIRVGTLTAYGSSVTLGGGNQIDTLGSVTATAGYRLGVVSIADQTNLSVSGRISGYTAGLGVTGALVLNNVVTAYQVSLTATGAITETSAGQVVATVLGGSAASAMLNRANTVGSLAGFSTTADFTLTDSQSLTVSRLTAGSSVGLGVAGSITINGALTGSTVSLAATGAITEVGGGQVMATTLTGSAASASLSQTNSVGTLGGFTTGTGLTLVNGQALTVFGPVVDGQSISVSAAGALTLSGSVTAPVVTLTSMGSRGGITQTAGSVNGSTSLSLTSSGTINQSGGTITAGTLTGSSAGTTSLGSTGNAVATLGSFSSAGGFTLADGQALAVSGPVSDNTSVTLSTTGALSLSGTVTTGALSLTASGAITQPGGGLVATSLTGSGAGVSLTQRANQIGTLGGFSSTADFALTDSVALTVSGAVSAGSGRTLTLVDDSPTFGSGGSLSAPSGTVVLSEYTAGRGLTIAGGGSLTGTPPVTATTLVVGASTGGPITVAGAFNLSSVSVLDLESGGAISETGAGAIRVATLTGNGASATLGGANQIGTLGRFTTAGAFSLTDAQSLTVSGTASATMLTLSATGDLVLSGTINAPNGLTLLATGAITQPSGSIITNNLTGAANTATLGSTTNTIATLAGFNTTGDFTLFDGRSLTVSAPVDPNTVTLSVVGDLTVNSSITGGVVNLTATGAIAEGPGGQVIATVLAGSANSANLGGANQVGTLGAFQTTAGLVFADAQPLLVSGTVADGQFVTLSSAGAVTLTSNIAAPIVTINAGSGGITQTGGTLAAGTAAGLNTSGGVSQTGGAIVTGSSTTPGALTVIAGGPVTIGAVLSTGGLAISTPGSVTQTGGILSATALGGAAGGQITLGTAGSTSILAVANLSSATGITLRDSTPLQLSGTLAAPNLAITATGVLGYDNGVIRTNGLPPSQQSGASPSLPGSYFQVLAGPDGRAMLRQTGVTTVLPYSGTSATLRFDLPASGGMLSFNALNADTVNLVLSLGTGTATGTLDANSLAVLATGGTADFAGQVGGRNSFDAAQISAITPVVSNSYTLNGCAIGAATCSNTAFILTALAQVAAGSSTIRPDIVSLDVLDLSVTRDRDDPTLLLPNISDRDY